MCKVAIVLTCLACAVHGRRVLSSESMQSRPLRDSKKLLENAHSFAGRAYADDAVHSSKALTRLLLALDPESAFTPSRPGARLPLRPALVPAASRSVHTEPDAASMLLRLRGGATQRDILKATYESNQLRASLLAEAASKVAALRKSLVNGEAIPDFAETADEIIADALDTYETRAPKDDSEVKELYDAKKNEVRTEILRSLEPAFVQQICLLKDAALELFKKGLVSDGDSSEALVEAEAVFVRAASESVPKNTGWEFSLERESLVGAMRAMHTEQKKLQNAKLESAQQMQTALTFLHGQQQQMQNIQAEGMARMGGKWNLGAAYRPSGTDINLSGAYQQGRCNLQISLVPDESANLLGNSGWNGVQPANLGLSFNVHL